MSIKMIFGFHAVGVRIKVAPASVLEVFVDPARRDARMRQFVDRAKEAGVRLIDADGARLTGLAGGTGHQGVVARVNLDAKQETLDEMLDRLQQEGEDQPEDAALKPLLLVLDGVTDPHNLGACLRTADGVGAHAVVAPKDHAVGVNATVAKVASGAADTVPYFMVTNLARTLKELKERGIWVVGTSDQATKDLYDVDLRGPTALVLGAEGDGMRALTTKTCDELVRLPMRGAVESLNVSVASAVCLYEATRQRHHVKV
jgi:23S rRNA (guanosine2251-2'-O)-methyltransferase